MVKISRATPPEEAQTSLTCTHNTLPISGPQVNCGNAAKVTTYENVQISMKYPVAITLSRHSILWKGPGGLLLRGTDHLLRGNIGKGVQLRESTKRSFLDILRQSSQRMS